ncbi:super-infection exclusion protein B [Carboxylicivirga marina]|uniref:super-infection exclusion protein B n=1 Tax=Carboxylicivirga marina TaxID=2800988 RepID=UPI0025929B0C|nr:super-infection exclusion protein B [uncultured Carboxylicivirga sp.]
MEKYISAIFDFTKLPTKVLFLFAVVSGSILFVNENIINKLQLDALLKKHGWVLGLVFLLSSCFVVVNLIIWTINKIRAKRDFRAIKEKYIKRLRNLDRHEQAVLREFIAGGKKSINMPLDEPVIAGLMNDNILVLNKTFGNQTLVMGYEAPLSINEFAMENISYKDIGLKGDRSDVEIEFIKNNRPSWTRSLY